VTESVREQAMRRMREIVLSQRPRRRPLVVALMALAAVLVIAVADTWRTAAATLLAAAAVLAMRARFSIHGALLLLAVVAILTVAGLGPGKSVG
jgi:uncharacterized membrane protein YjjP (DUF1212 family)